MTWLNLITADPKRIEERIKLAANGLQALALTLLATVIIAPTVNHGLNPPPLEEILAGIVAATAEVAAFFILGYIPTIRKDTTA